MRMIVILLAASLAAACEGPKPSYTQLGTQLGASPDMIEAQGPQSGDNAAATAEGSEGDTASPQEMADAAPPQASPASAPAPAAAKPQHIELTAMRIDPNPSVGASVPVSLSYSGSHAPDVKRVCFLWSGDGPYCWDFLSVDAKAGQINTSLTMKEAKAYTIAGYVEYQTAGRLYKSNTLSAPVAAHP
ncbi:hypothetical protein [Microbaculum sp. FT89]|uniref:hypothetical protein n=1 Tax=Microbaculum sp. FT89 TaxID=3447298 RepID=UPI003F532206